jgi:hypothetical protein
MHLHLGIASRMDAEPKRRVAHHDYPYDTVSMLSEDGFVNTPADNHAPVDIGMDGRPEEEEDNPVTVQTERPIPATAQDAAKASE